MSSSVNRPDMACEGRVGAQKSLIPCDFKALRPIARRQIVSLLHRFELTYNKALYLSEIRKILEYEQGDKSK